MLIFVRGLEFYGFHGASDEEQTIGHRYLVDIEMHVRTEAQQTDRLAETVDYGRVAKRAQEVGQNTQFRTVERLAEEIGRTLLSEHERIDRVRISVSKPYPPAPVIAAAVGVTHEFTR